MTNRILWGRAMALACAGISVSSGYAQLSVGSLGFTYSQTFDSLSAGTAAEGSTQGSWANNSTIAGWYAGGISESGVASTVPGNNYRISAGGTSNNDLYSFGSALASDRALGTIATAGSANSARTLNFGLQLQNNTGSPISRIHVQYYGEQWRADQAANQSLDFSYRVGSAAMGSFTNTYTSVSALQFNSPQDTDPVSKPLDGNLAANRVLITASFAVTVPAGQYIMLRWSDSQIGSNLSHGLAIDDLFVSVPEAGTWGAGLGLTGIVGWTMLRRRRG